MKLLRLKTTTKRTEWEVSTIPSNTAKLAAIHQVISPEERQFNVKEHWRLSY